MSIVTLKERKSRETARRAEAARAVIDRLRAFIESTDHRGHFIVFGSVASGAVRYSSDFDVLIAFPPDLEPAAWRAVEDACAKFDIPADIHSMRTTKPDFIELILGRAVEIID